MAWECEAKNAFNGIQMQYPEPESSMVELKREFPQNDQIVKTVIGFCNQQGGKLIIGVDSQGEIVGVPDDQVENALEYLEKMIYEAASPTIIPKVYAHRFGDLNLLVVEVSPGMTKPYFRRSEGVDRGTYIRLGRSTVRATPDLIEELRWQSIGVNFETLPNRRATVQDLDLERVQFFLNHRKNQAPVPATDDLLRAYQLTVLEHAHHYPTQAGLLLFGKHPQHFLSEAIILCSHFEGTAGRTALASVDCEGTLFQQFQQALAFVVSRLYKSFAIHGIIRDEQLEIPEIALREALLNAIVHRNYHIPGPTKIAIYDDRVEIFSPGAFPGPAMPQNLRAGITFLRNPVICKIFREMGYIEKLGTGILTIFQSYAERGLATPEILGGDQFVKVILPRKAMPAMLGGEDKILSTLFGLSPEISLLDVQRLLGVTRSTAARRMSDLINRGLVDRIGNTRAVRYRRRS